MRKATKIWLIIAASLVLVGCILFAGVMIMFNWNFEKLSTKKYETNTYEISEEFNNISLHTDTADIVFALSDDGNCRVECYEEEKVQHTVSVEGGTLKIIGEDNRKWYEYIGINIGSPNITVYLPESEYTQFLIRSNTGNVKIPKDFMFETVDICLSTGAVDFYASASETVKIKTSTGAVHVERNSVGALDLKVTTGKVTVSDMSCNGDITVEVTTGKVTLSDIACKSFLSSGSTGDISLENVIAAEKISIERSTGDVNFDGSDAAEIFVKTDTGDVKGSLLTDKVFITQTDTGNVDVPKTVNGGRCEIITDTGDIKIK